VKADNCSDMFLYTFRLGFYKKLSMERASSSIIPGSPLQLSYENLLKEAIDKKLTQ
jgi:hypothetical protein